MGEGFEATVVGLIIDGKTEKALKILAERYEIDTPHLKVGLPKGYKRKTLACYSSQTKTISVLNSETLKDPTIILHEFYHHLRTDVIQRHRGTEKHADEFAKRLIQTYKSLMSSAESRK